MIRMLDTVVQSSAVLLFGLALMPLLRSRSAALRHWVLAGALICAAAVPVIGRLAPAWSAPLDLSFATRALSVPAPQAFASGAGPAVSVGEVRAASVPIPQADRPTIGALLMIVWLAGMALSLAALLAGLVRLGRLSRGAQLLVSGPWVDAVTGWAVRHGVTRPVSVRVVDHPALLLVWGLWRPTLIVPGVASAWTADRITAVVQHELAHIRRADWLTQVLSEVIRAVYWFNPLVWLTCARLRTECEVASDDAVLANGVNGTDYAAHIVGIARDLNTRYWVPAPAIVRPSTLERRIRAMLDSSRDRRPLSMRARSTDSALIIVATMAVAGLAAQTFGSVAGTIVDPSNSVLPGVTLVLTNEQSGAKYQIKTDRTGRYEFVGLPPGSYTLDAALPGFARFESRVTVSGQQLQQDLTMSVGTLEETVTVRWDAPLPSPDPERAARIETMKQKRAAAAPAPVSAGGGVRIGGNLRVPLKYRDVYPHYPEALRTQEGVVVLDARIGVTGSVDEVNVVSSTHAEFSESAITAVRQWEFGATLLNGEPVETPMRITVNFRTH